MSTSATPRPPARSDRPRTDDQSPATPPAGSTPDTPAPAASYWETHRQRYTTAAVHVGLVVLMLVAVSLTLGRSPRGVARASGDPARDPASAAAQSGQDPAPTDPIRLTALPASTLDTFALPPAPGTRTPTPLGRAVTPPPSSSDSPPSISPEQETEPNPASPRPTFAVAMPQPRITQTITETPPPPAASSETDTAKPAARPADPAAAEVRALAAAMTRSHRPVPDASAGLDRPVRQALPYMRDPHATVGGIYGSPGATHVVYLVDASGSMIDTLPFVLAQLQQALRTLRPAQTFTVMFASGRGVTELPPLGMKRVTPDATAAAVRWLDPLAGRVVASGRGDAHAAVLRALAYQPDAIVLLTDGITGRHAPDPAHRARLLQLADSLNPSATTFHTLQLRRPDPSAFPDQPGILESLAQLTAGTFRYVPDAQLNP